MGRATLVRRLIGLVVVVLVGGAAAQTITPRAILVTPGGGQSQQFTVDISLSGFSGVNARSYRVDEAVQVAVTPSLDAYPSRRSAMMRKPTLAALIGLLGAVGGFGMAQEAPTPTSIVLPDGAICRFAGFGATVAFDGKRLNYSCGSPEVGLVGDVLTSAEQAAAERVFLERGDDGWRVGRRDLVVMTFGVVELADNSLCAFAGRGATLAFDGKRLNYSCGGPEAGLLGDFDYENGVFYAEKVALEHGDDGFAVADRAFVAVRTLNASTPLVGSEWRLEAYGAEGGLELPLPGREPTLMITERGVAGSSGCNRFTGSIGVNKDAVTVGAIAATRMMCDEAVMAQERRFFDLLQDVTRFALAENTLTLFSGDERLVLVPIRLEPARGGEPEIASSQERDPEAFNMLIGPYNADPLAAALSVLNLPNAPTVRITRQDEGGEGATRSVITVIAEGLLDDAVAGSLTRLVFERGSDGRWSVTSAIEAVQCRRNGEAGRFVAGPCP